MRQNEVRKQITVELGNKASKIKTQRKGRQAGKRNNAEGKEINFVKEPRIMLTLGFTPGFEDGLLLEYLFTLRAMLLILEIQ